MTGSNDYYWNDFFSHVYVEERAYGYPETESILSNIKNKTVIPIKHYKDVFSPRQDFTLQKNSLKLILAVKDGGFLYKIPPVCLNYGNDDAYYVSLALNCPYDCAYCFLRGLYASANIVAFVNAEDAFGEITRALKNKKPYLCVSYDTDLLAMEHILGTARKWIRFARENPLIMMEIRTKSANYNAIADLAPAPNVILAWSLSPEGYINAYESGAPGLGARLKNINRAADGGWNVRLCVDPLLYLPGCADVYRSFIKETFAQIPADKILDISFGPLRAPAAVMKKIEKAKPGPLTAYPFVNQNGVYTYRDNHLHEIYDVIKSALPAMSAYFYR